MHSYLFVRMCLCPRNLLSTLEKQSNNKTYEIQSTKTRTRPARAAVSKIYAQCARVIELAIQLTLDHVLA